MVVVTGDPLPAWCQPAWAGQRGGRHSELTCGLHLHTLDCFTSHVKYQSYNLVLEEEGEEQQQQPRMAGRKEGRPSETGWRQSCARARWRYIPAGCMHIRHRGSAAWPGCMRGRQCSAHHGPIFEDMLPIVPASMDQAAQQPGPPWKHACSPRIASP